MRVAIIVAGVAAIAGSYLWANRLQVVNQGSAFFVVDKWTGDVTLCDGHDCRPHKQIPPPPPGYVID